VLGDKAMKFQYRLMMPGELTSLVTVYQKNQAALGWTAAAHPVGQSKPLTNFRTVRDIQNGIIATEH